MYAESGYLSVSLDLKYNFKSTLRIACLSWSYHSCYRRLQHNV